MKEPIRPQLDWKVRELLYTCSANASLATVISDQKQSKTDQSATAAAEENFYKTAIDLTNISNTCWFNSVMQAVTVVLKISSQKIDHPNLNAVMMILANIINILLKHKSDDCKVLQNVVFSVCNLCKLEFGKEQDPEEYFALPSWIYLLSVNGVSCISQLQVDIRCTSSNDVAYEPATELTDISVPILQTVERVGGLQEYINGDLSKKKGRVCNKCNRRTKRVTRIQFNKLLNLLVMRLDRATFTLGTSISKDNTPVALNQVIFLQSKSTQLW